MLFATTIGEHSFFAVLFALFMVGMFVKAIASNDTDGQVKSAVHGGLARMIERWLK